MLKSRLCDYSDRHILVKGTTLVANMAGASESAKKKTIKKVLYKNRSWFIDCISKANKIKVSTARDCDVVKPICGLTGCNDIYCNFKITIIIINLQQYCEDEPPLNANKITGFDGANNTNLFDFKAKINCQTDKDGRKTLK